jgi:hypothetical protein
MTVQRTQVGHQTRYTLEDGDVVSCVLTYGDFELAPAVWKALLPGPGGTEDLYGTQRFLTPDKAQLTDWLTPIVGGEHAAELADAVDAEPPKTSGWSPSPS